VEGMTAHKKLSPEFPERGSVFDWVFNAEAGSASPLPSGIIKHRWEVCPLNGSKWGIFRQAMFARG